MKKIAMIALSCALGFTAGPSMAQDSALTQDIMDDADMLGKRALASSLTEDVITSLTTEVGHRLAGTANDKKGRDWAMAKMKAMGFDRVWEEPVTIPLWHRGSASARVTAPYQHNMAIVALGNSIATPEGGLTAEIAHFDEYKDLVAAPAGSLDGKIAYISFLDFVI
jgi:hypothetical protein